MKHIIPLLCAVALIGCAGFELKPENVEDAAWSGATALLVADDKAALDNAKYIITAADNIDKLKGDVSIVDLQAAITKALPANPRASAIVGVVVRVARRFADWNQPIKPDVLQGLSKGLRDAAEAYIPS